MTANHPETAAVWVCAVHMHAHIQTSAEGQRMNEWMSECSSVYECVREDERVAQV